MNLVSENHTQERRSIQRDLRRKVEEQISQVEAMPTDPDKWVVMLEDGSMALVERRDGMKLGRFGPPSETEHAAPFRSRGEAAKYADNVNRQAAALDAKFTALPMTEPEAREKALRSMRDVLALLGLGEMD